MPPPRPQSQPESNQQISTTFAHSRVRKQKAQTNCEKWNHDRAEWNRIAQRAAQRPALHNFDYTLLT